MNRAFGGLARKLIQDLFQAVLLSVGNQIARNLISSCGAVIYGVLGAFERIHFGEIRSFCLLNRNPRLRND